MAMLLMSFFMSCSSLCSFYYNCLARPTTHHTHSSSGCQMTLYCLPTVHETHSVSSSSEVKSFSGHLQIRYLCCDLIKCCSRLVSTMSTFTAKTESDASSANQLATPLSSSTPRYKVQRSRCRWPYWTFSQGPFQALPSAAPFLVDRTYWPAPWPLFRGQLTFLRSSGSIVAPFWPTILLIGHT